MRIDEYISGLRKNNNIIITVDNDEVKIRAEKEKLTQEIVDGIRARKSDILAFFRGTQGTQSGTVPASEVKPYYRLSSAQKRLYFLHELDRASLAYNLPHAVRLLGRFDRERLVAVFNKLVMRHESLRTSFRLVNDEPVQVIAPEVELGIVYYEASEEALPRIIRSFIQPFDLAQAPLLRIGLVQLAPEEHVLLFDMHHIVTDGVSQGLLVREFMALYNREELPSPALQYRDFAEWQQGAEQQAKIGAQRAFWLNEFAEEPAALELPADRARPAVKDFSGAGYRFGLDATATEALNALARREGVTMYMVLLAAYNVLLSRLGNAEDIVVGTPLAGRTLPELNEVFGMFVNTLPLRMQVDGGKSFAEFLSVVKSRTVAAFSRQDYPYEQLVDELKVPRSFNRNPLFDVSFDFQNFRTSVLEMPGLTVEPYGLGASFAKFDLSLSSWMAGEGLEFHFEYSTELFREATIGRFSDYFRAILLAVAADASVRIGDIELLSAAERVRLTNDFNDTDVSVSTKNIIELFEEQAALRPDAIALQWPGGKMTYADVQAQSDLMAGRLYHLHGIRRGDLVGILLDREAAFVPAMLGVLKCGAAYIPIDPKYPEERVQGIIEDSGLKLLVSRAKHLPEGITVASLNLDEAVDVNGYEKIKEPIEPHDLAYIIYTSGSTGKPKGVMIEHHSLVNIISHLQRTYPLNEGDNYLLKTSFTFDVSVAELFGWFVNGGTLTVLPAGSEGDPEEIISQIHDFGVTHINFVPSMFALFLEEVERQGVGAIDSLRWVFLAGEALPVELVRRWTALGAKALLENIYGPTEGTIYSCAYPASELPADAVRMPIGKPLSNIRLYVVHRNGQLQPVGVAGELLLAGEGLARGYLHNENLTEEKFYVHPVIGERVYSTGDLARWTEDGNIEYLGRIDHQVKIRGFRIELGEIESRLLQHDAIRDAVVIVKERSEGDKILVAYYVAEKQLDEATLRAYLADRLPAYMVPAYFMHLPALPLTVSGKVDRKALPMPEVRLSEGYVAPQTPAEILLASVWAQVLGLSRIGITDNFFSVGGDSIKSIQIVSRLRSAGYQLKVKDLFAAQTIGELAPLMQRSDAVADQSEVVGTSPLTPVQHWLLDGHTIDPHHFNQSVALRFTQGITKEEVTAIFGKLQAHHDALRMRFVKDGERYIVHTKSVRESALSLTEHNLSEGKDFTTIANELQSSIDLENGPLMKLALMHDDGGSRLLIVIHHLVVDGISWRILFEDFETLYSQIKNGEALSLPLKTDAFQRWPLHLEEYKQTTTYKKAIDYWSETESLEQPSLLRDHDATATNIIGDNQELSFELSADATAKLLTTANRAFNTQVPDVLLAGLMLAIQQQYGQDHTTIMLEGHGREDLLPGINISRTVGWFTSLYPVTLTAQGASSTDVLKHVKEALHRVPNKGIDYLLYQSETGQPFPHVQLFFNYLGQFDADLKDRPFILDNSDKGQEASPNRIEDFDWNVTAVVVDGKLRLRLAFSPKQYHKERVSSLLQHYKMQLQHLIDTCAAQTTTQLTPSDLTYKNLEIEQLDELQQQYDIEDIYTLTPMQEGMLFHDLLQPEADHYFEQMTCSIGGPLSLAGIQKSLDGLTDRYAVLRTLFLHEGLARPLQLVLRHRPAPVSYIDLRHLDDAEQATAIDRYRDEDRRRKFSLSSDPLVRLAVLHTGAGSYTLIWSYHHIIMDGWCMGILMQDFRERYTAFLDGRTIGFQPTIPYSRYISWLEARDKQASADYWARYLSGYDTAAGLPRRDKSMPTNKQLVQTYALSRRQADDLQKLSKELGVSLNTILQAAWGLLLARYNNTNDVVFGAVVSGRPSEIEGVEGMVGLFINTVPVRINTGDGDTVAALLNRLQDEAFQAAPHHYHPLNEIQTLSELGRGLLDHLLVFENFPVAREVEKGGADRFVIQSVEAMEETSYDLTVIITPGEDTGIRFHYNPGVYDDALISKAAAHFLALIDAVTTDADVHVNELPFLTVNEHQRLIHDFNDTDVSVPTKNIIELFEEQAARTPNAIALQWPGGTMTYADVQAQSDLMAQRLYHLHSIRRSDLVGLLLDREAAFVPVMLAVLKCGAAYIPIDPKYPEERIQAIIEDSGLKLLVSRTKHLPEGLTAASLNLDEAVDVDGYEKIKEAIEPHDLAYIIYTSGSTGKPKGVMIEHHSLVNIINHLQKAYPLNEGDNYLLKTSFTFDVSVAELFGWFVNGGTLTVLPAGSEGDPEEIIRQIQNFGVTHINFVPSMFALFLEEVERQGVGSIDSLRWVFLAGEALPVELVRRWTALGAKALLENIYGPTEGTIYSCAYPASELPLGAVRMPIGKPLSNIRLYVVHRNGQLQPVGVAGELLLAGEGLARGYLHNESLTEEKFYVHPVIGERVYSTGDLARWTEDGNIEYLGRIDHQVKIRGFRIELGEIESQLLRHDAIREAVVVAKERGDANASRYLAAYYVATTEVTPEELRLFLAGRLPEYMVPAAYVSLDQLPLTVSGKVDRKALPEPDRSASDAYVSPRTETEELLASVWAQVLGVSRIGITDNFFSVGGDSIKSIQIVSRLRTAGYQLKVKDLFAAQTIGELAPLMQRSGAVADQSEVVGSSPLTPVQHWLLDGHAIDPHHFNQSVALRFTQGITKEEVTAIFGKLQAHHDALRMRFVKDGERYIVHTKSVRESGLSLTEYNLSEGKDFTAIANDLQSSIDLENGPLMKLALMHDDGGSRLLIVIHHLVVDGISWRILFEDFETLYHQIKNGEAFSLPLKTDAFQHWPAHLEKYRQTKDYQEAKKYWQEATAGGETVLLRDADLEAPNRLGENEELSFELSAEATAKLLTSANRAFNTQVPDVLLTALTLAIQQQYGQDRTTIMLEGHGREDLLPGIDIGRTVGWFTSLYPVTLTAQGASSTDVLKHVKEALHRVPNKGIDYLLHQSETGRPFPHVQLFFNYLGQFDADLKGRPFILDNSDKGQEASSNRIENFDWNVTAVVVESKLQLRLAFSPKQYHKEGVSSLLQHYETQLQHLIDDCAAQTTTQLTPSDLTYKNLEIEQLDELQQQYNIEDIYTLTPMQEGMLFHTLVDSASGSYFGQTTCRINGPLDIPTVQLAMNRLIARHPVLRTLFLHEGHSRRLQLVLHSRRIDFAFHDLRGEDTAHALETFKQLDRARPFDLTRDTLMRLTILQTADQTFECIWSHHHVLMDGWCMGIVVGEFERIYTDQVKGRASSLPPVAPYSRYIAWLEQKDKDAAAAYWAHYLAGYDSAATLPRQAANGLPYRQTLHVQQLDTARTDALRRLARRLGASLNTVFQAAWAILLACYNNTNDVVFGAVVSGRPSEIEGVENMVGLFINTIPVRVRLQPGETVELLVQRLQREALDSEPHHYHPLADIQSGSELGRGLIDHILVFENLPEPVEAGEPLFHVDQVSYRVQTDYDLNIIVSPTDALKIEWDYNANQYTKSTIVALATALDELLRSLAAAPEAPVEDVSPFNAREKAALTAQWSRDLSEGLRIGTIQELLQQSFSTHTDQTAIETGHRSYTYREIDEKARALAATLRRRGAVPGSFVGVYAEDRVHTICSILAVLRIGGAFVPLETTLPKARLSLMIEQAACAFILTDRPAAAWPPASPSIEWIAVDEATTGDEEQTIIPDGDSPVYVYFTSGSTGVPKGVVGCNRGLAHFISWEIGEFGIDSTFRFSQFTNPGFDVFMRDLFVPLCAGATICIPGEETLSTAEGIGAWIDRASISFIHCVPSLFKLFLAFSSSNNIFEHLRYVLLAGEKIAPFDLREWYRRIGDRVQLVNIYGPTETTLAKGFHRITPTDMERSYIPLRPIRGAQFLLLDEHLQPVPQQATGEIWIRTPFRSLGYLDAATTQQAFRPNPFSNDAADLIYRTGDLGRTHEDGALEIMGRRDHQVKIRGIRIELEDIRRNLLNYPGIREAAVAVKEDSEGGKLLCAYFTSRDREDESELRAYLESVLPRHMVPSFLVQLDKMPLTPNGKLDRKALPDPQLRQESGGQAASDTERKLRAIWAEVLRTDEEKVALDKTFFELGGHSIKVFQLINRIQQEFGIKLKLGQVFQYGSIQKLAGLLQQLDASDGGLLPLAEERATYAASPAQERMYFQQMLMEDATVFNMPMAIEVKGEINTVEIRKTLQALVDRHGSLRTSFRLGDDGVEQKLEDGVTIDLETIDARQYPTVEAAFRAFTRPFDLERAPLMRSAVWQGDEGSFLFVDLHHIVADGTSLDILIREFVLLDEGKELPPLQRRYIDYSEWINSVKGSLEKQKAYWLDRLAGDLPRLELPVSPRSLAPGEPAAAQLLLHLDQEDYRALKEAAVKAEVSDFMYLLSVFYLLLARVGNTDDVIVGTDVIGRSQPGLKDIVGTFVNILPLRARLREGRSFNQLLQETKGHVLDAFENQDFGIDQIVALLGRDRNGNKRSIIDVHFSIANTLESHILSDRFATYPLAGSREETSEYGFKLEVRERDGRMEIAFIYSRALFDETTIQLLMDYYRHLLRSVLREPSTLLEYLNLS